MKSEQSKTSTLSGIISIILIYILLIILILVFANQILSDVSKGSSFENIIVLILAITLPVFLLIMIGINIIKLIRDRRANKPGIRIKLRLIFFFSFITILASIPQGILSLSFINTAMNSWLSPSLGDALEGGLHIALEYNSNAGNNLQGFSESIVFNNILQDITGSPDRVWDNLRGANPVISCLQVFTADNNELFHRGDSRGKLSLSPADLSSERLIRTKIGKLSILRILKTLYIKDIKYTAVLSTILPENFAAEAELLTEAIETFTQYRMFQNQFYSALIVFFGFFSFPIFLLSILISFILGEEIIRPIVNLEVATKRVADGDYSFKILGRSRDELSVLTGSFNVMIQELERSRIKLKQTEKVTAWQEIAQRMAHEIKNPLTPIKLSAQRILRKFKSNPESINSMLEPAVSSIITEVENLNMLLDEFKKFARHPSPQITSTNVYTLISEAVSLYSSSFQKVSIHLENLQKDVIIDIDKNQIKQVFSNLLKNAFEALKGTGSIFIRSDLVRKGNNQYCRIQIRDTGCGINAEDYSKVFNPYFTTKSDGTGLGLPIVERLISDHKGQIWFETQIGIGTTFYIDLPLEIEK